MHTPYSKMAATQDGLGRVARKRGIEGHGTRDSTREPQGNGQTYCEFRGKKYQNSEYHSLPTGLRKAKAFLADEYLHEIQTHQDQSYFYLYRAKCFHSFKVREEPHNLKLALCIVSGEVE